MDDVVVVGGGIIGAATAYFLSKEGRKVRVIERDPTYKKASFPLSLGGFRRQFFQKENINLGKFALEFISNISNTLKTKNNPNPTASLVPNGYLLLFGPEHAQEQLTKGFYRRGYRDGVILATVDEKLVDNYICTLVKIDKHTTLQAKMVKRRPEEASYIQIRSLNGTPLKTGSVDLILYRHDVLMETNEHSTDDEWELISFHAIPKGITEMPMGPTTMMRNQLQLTGGTKAYFESEKWAYSVKFWQEHAILTENDSIRSINREVKLCQNLIRFVDPDSGWVWMTV